MADIDAIVVGSGAGGMAAAVALARAGQKVLVLERHYVQGGWCHSFTLGGLRFSPGVHYLGELQRGGSLRRIYEGLGVAGHLTFHELNPDGFDHVQVGHGPDAFRFDIPRGKEVYAERLGRRFPSEARGIRGYLDVVEKISKELIGLLDVTSPLQMITMPLKIPATLRWGLFPAAKVIASFVSDPMLSAILGIQCGDHGLPPERVPMAMHAATAGHYLNGGWYPKGGGFTIPRAFLRVLEKHGGELRLEADVERILVEKGRAIGVRLVGGEEITAKRVISNADPQVTFGRLVAPEHVPARVRRRLARTRWSISALSLFLGVEMDARAAGLDSGNYWYTRTPDIGRSYATGASMERILEDPLEGLFLTVTSAKDPGKKKKGVETMEAFTMVPYGAFEAWAESRFGARPDAYARAKDTLRDKMLGELEHLVPGLSRRVTFSEVGTPLTNVHYVNATAGSLYGTEKKLLQVGPFAWQPKTPIRDLWLCGASTVGHGVVGATVSGLVAASLALGVPPSALLERRAGEGEITLVDIEAAARKPAAPVAEAARAHG